MEETGKDNKSYNGAQRASSRFSEEVEPSHVRLCSVETEAEDLLPPVLRDERGLFQPGTRGGPGAPSQGRRAAIAILDEMLAQADNKQRLRESMQASFSDNPMRFFRTIIMPLLPKTALLAVASDGGNVASAIASVRQALGMPNNGGNGGGGGV